MARHVFFSFHYTRDIFRVNTIRNHNMTKSGLVEAGYIDHSLWEKSKLQGDAALKKLIDDGLAGSSVTAVLIGKETAGRRWVEYEIKQSQARGNGIIGIYINKIAIPGGLVDTRGLNPVPAAYSTYDWVENDGYNNFGKWIEAAAKAAGR